MRRFAFFVSCLLFALNFFVVPVLADTNVNLPEAPVKQEHIKIQVRPPFHIRNFRQNALVTTPAGLNPTQVKTAYNLPTTGGSGTVAIVDAYDNPTAENDLATFSTQFGLPSCTTANGCFKKVKTSGFVSANSGWALEESLDVQWAHALAPQAKVLLVEAKSSRLSDLLSAVSYAKSQPGVVSVSLSWGSGEFSGSNTYDSYFTQSGVAFFASSGDNGTQVSWPAVSQNVIGVGGTTLSFSGSSVSAETAWNGSGGGISSFINEPSYQTAFGVVSNGKRAVPDVSFDADPNSGVSVYDSYGYGGQKGWFILGGTSVGAPSWAAIKALNSNVSSSTVYTDAKNNYSFYFRDITTGSNGSCGAVCTATTGFDFVTGLGSPLNSF